MSDHMESNQESNSPISLKLLLDKLNSMESRMEDNFSELYSQIAQLTYEFKEEINGIKHLLKEFEKSLNNSGASNEDLQQESKAFKDLKSSHQKMLDEHGSEIQQLKTELIKVKAKNDKLQPPLKETQEKLIALENCIRRENLQFMNIPTSLRERESKNCTDIMYDRIENHLKINPEDIRFHAVHRVGKPSTQDDSTTPSCPQLIIARFVVREERDVLRQIHGCLHHSKTARAIQQERKTLIQAMFAAKKMAEKQR